MTVNAGQERPTSTNDRRSRGTHSTACKNPLPLYDRPADWKPLPGELGRTFNCCRKRDVSRDPLFVHLRRVVGRERDFQQLRRQLINPFFQICISRVDLATGILELTLEQIAEELDVSVARISRLVDEVMIPFGLMYVEADPEAHHKKRGLVWDRVNHRWFPKVLVLTDQFWRIAGARLDRLSNQQADQLAHRQTEVSQPGEVLSVAEARRRKREQILARSWELRKTRAKSGKRRSNLSEKSLDERKHDVATKLVKQWGRDKVEMLTPEEFDREVWRRLNRMGLGVSPPKPDAIH